MDSSFVGSCAYAYGITQIVSIVSNLSKATNRYHFKMDVMHEYMDVRALPIDLKDRILEFYEFKKEHSCEFLRENDILQDLPHSLRSEVSMYANGAMMEKLRNIPLFKVQRQDYVPYIPAESTKNSEKFFPPCFSSQ